MNIHVDLPEEREFTGKYDVYPGAVVTTVRLYTRKIWQPPHYLPDGCWVYRHEGPCWFVSRMKPDPECGAPFAVLIRDLADLHGETFNPPPTDIIQVKHE